MIYERTNNLDLAENVYGPSFQALRNKKMAYLKNVRYENHSL